MTADQDAAIDFYTRVVGWTASDAEPARHALHDPLAPAAAASAACFQLTDEMRAGGARPGWLGYIHVADADAKAKEIEACRRPDADAAGRHPRCRPLRDGRRSGRRGLLPADAAAARTATGRRPSSIRGTVGTVGWRELYSSNGEEAAFDFYSGQFGWETVTEMDMGPMGKYRIFGQDGEQLGGMMDKPGKRAGLGLDLLRQCRRHRCRGRADQGQWRIVDHGPDGGARRHWVVQAIDPQGAAFRADFRRLVEERRR